MGSIETAVVHTLQTEKAQFRCKVLQRHALVFFNPLSGAPILSLENVLSAIQDVRNSRRLSDGFNVHDAWDEMCRANSSREDTLRAIVLAWLGNKRQHSWRRVIWALDVAGETSAADLIMDYAEPLAGRHIYQLLMIWEWYARRKNMVSYHIRHSLISWVPKSY